MTKKSWVRFFHSFLAAFFLLSSSLAIAEAQKPKVLKLALGEPPVTLNRFIAKLTVSSDVIAMLFVPSFSLHNQPVPWGVFEKYELSEDQLTYTFHMKKGLIWSDGSPATVSDIIRGLRYALEKKAEISPGYFSYLSNIALDTEGNFKVSELDKLTLQIHLKKKSPLFIHQFGNSHTPALKPNQQTISTKQDSLLPASLATLSPYRISESNLPESLVLEKIPTFPGAEALHWDRVEVAFIPERERKLRAFQQGKVDAMSLHHLSSTGLLEQFPGKLVRRGLPATKFIVLSADNKHLQNPLLRKAIKLLADPLTLTPSKSVLDKPLYTLIPAELDAIYSSSYQTVDYKPVGKRADRLREAGKILESLNITPENPLELRLMVQDVRDQVQSGKRLQHIAAAYGLRLNLIKSEIKQHFGYYFSGDFDLHLHGWINTAANAAHQMTPHTDGTPPFNQKGYSNSSYFSGLERFKKAVHEDTDELYKSITALEKIILEENYILPFTQAHIGIMVKPKIDKEQLFLGPYWTLRAAE